jgi:hypothetical protein
MRLGEAQRPASFPFATEDTREAVCRIAAGADIVPDQDTFVRSKVKVPGEGGGTEAELWASVSRNRRAEKAPPEVPRFEVGTLRADSAGELDELRELSLDPELVLYPEGSKSNATTEKYQAWLEDGHEPPPARAIEQESGKIKVQDGHHRATALRAVGRTTMLAWVSMTYLHEIGPEVFSGRGITVEVAQQLAPRFCQGGRVERRSELSAFGGLFGTARF